MLERERTRSRIECWSTICQNRNASSSTSPNSLDCLEHLGRVGQVLLGADDLAEPLHPRDPLVALVPDQGEPAARPEHAGDLGQRPVVVEPVERLRAHHHVVRRVAGGDLLGRGLRRRGRRGGSSRGWPASSGPARSRARRGRGPPAARSACRCRRRARGRSAARSEVSQTAASRGYVGPAAVVGVRDPAEGAGRLGLCSEWSMLITFQGTGSIAFAAVSHSDDPLAWLASLEGVPSAFAAARDGIDVVLRDRGLRRTSPETTAESLLRGAHASRRAGGFRVLAGRGASRARATRSPPTRCGSRPGCSGWRRR